MSLKWNQCWHWWKASQIVNAQMCLVAPKTIVTSSVCFCDWHGILLFSFHLLPQPERKKKLTYTTVVWAVAILVWIEQIYYCQCYFCEHRHVTHNYNDNRRAMVVWGSWPEPVWGYPFSTPKISALVREPTVWFQDSPQCRGPLQHPMHLASQSLLANI